MRHGTARANTPGNASVAQAAREHPPRYVAQAAREHPPRYAAQAAREHRPRYLAHTVREDRPRYAAQIAALTEADREDVLGNLREAEGTFRQVLPELVLRLRGEPGGEFLTGDLADAMGKLSSALRTLEERVAEHAP